MALTGFAGNLMYLGTVQSPGTAFPHEYIELGSYDVTPDQREEIKAERDDNTRNLIRVTADGMKTAIHFKTRDNLTLSEVTALRNFFYNAESTAANHKERKIHLVFWNPDPYNTANPCYDEGDFYRPNMKFPIKRIEGNNIIFGALEIDLIEY